MNVKRWLKVSKFLISAASMIHDAYRLLRCCFCGVVHDAWFEELASVMLGQSSADSGPPCTMAQLMLAHKKVS